MTTGTPRNEEEVTSFSPGVAQKLISAPVGFLGAYPLPLAGDGNIQENSAVSVFHGCSCLGDCRINNSKLKASRFGHLEIVSEKQLSISTFRVIPIEMV